MVLLLLIDYIDSSDTVTIDSNDVAINRIY